MGDELDVDALLEAPINKETSALRAALACHTLRSLDAIGNDDDESIVTGCQALDQVLSCKEGLYCRRNVIELFGFPGCAKTQLALTLIAQQLKRDAAVAVIHAKGNFPIGRLAQILRNDDNMNEDGVERCQKSLILKKVRELQDLVTAVEHVAILVESAEINDDHLWRRLRLLVVDDVASPTISQFIEPDVFPTLLQQFGRLNQLLKRLAVKHGVYTLIINHATLRDGLPCPSLGKLMAPVADLRVFLARLPELSSKYVSMQIEDPDNKVLKLALLDVNDRGVTQVEEN